MTERIITDIHSHMLFGIDDGAESLEMSIEMLRQAQTQGVKNIFCTSHNWSVGTDSYNRNFELLKKVCTQECLDINIFEGMEIICSKRYLPQVIADINSGTVKTMNSTDFVLVEMFPDMTGSEIYECIDSLICNTGKRVILAHVERYEGLYEDNLSLMCLKEIGCFFQINAYSLVEESNPKIKAFARRMLHEKLADFLGSDAHRTNHRAPKYTAGVDYIYGNCKKDYADSICFKNAETLIKKAK